MDASLIRSTVVVARRMRRKHKFAAAVCAHSVSPCKLALSQCLEIKNLSTAGFYPVRLISVVVPILGVIGGWMLTSRSEKSWTHMCGGCGSGPPTTPNP